MRDVIGRTLPILGAAVLGTWIAGGAALAMDSCSGEFSATALQPLPAPAVVGLDLADSTPASSALVGAFSRGMQNAGAQIPPPSATVRLKLTYRIIGQGASDPGSSDSSGNGSSLWSGNSQTFMQGGIDRAQPDIPQYDAFAPAQTASSGLLIFRAEAHDAATGAIVWIGSAQCTVQTGDNQMLAYQLGQLIGGAIGRRRDRVAM